METKITTVHHCIGCYTNILYTRRCTEKWNLLSRPTVSIPLCIYYFMCASVNPHLHCSCCQLLLIYSSWTARQVDHLSVSLLVYPQCLSFSVCACIYFCYFWMDFHPKMCLSKVNLCSKSTRLSRVDLMSLWIYSKPMDSNSIGVKNPFDKKNSGGK